MDNSSEMLKGVRLLLDYVEGKINHIDSLDLPEDKKIALLKKLSDELIDLASK